jgi:hypothetical protein
MDRDIKKGDFVNLKIKVDWYNEKVKNIKVKEIKHIQNNWSVAVISEYYLHSDGKLSNEVLLSNLEKDLKSKRKDIIKKLFNY